MKIRVLAIIVIAAITAGCGRGLIRKKAYEPSLQHMNEGHVTKALKALPSGERGGFIRIMEQTYLNLLDDHADIEELARYAEAIDSRVRYDVSREMMSFFYLETPEGYYASEHEVIWMHILLAWGYAQQANQEKSEVECRKAANLLSMAWSPEGRFDDPVMRVVLAAVWAMNGNWESAQVDFRRAAQMDRKLSWARELGNLDVPPAALYIVLTGSGMEPFTRNHTAITAAGAIAFVSSVQQTPLTLIDAAEKPVRGYITGSSIRWYQRHLERDNNIHELIQQSHYGKDIVTSGGINVARVVGSTILGTLVITGGIAVGGVIIVMGIYAESAELASLGIVPIVGGCKWGVDIIQSGYRKAKEDFRRDTDFATTYRFVRFLPEHVQSGWSVSGYRWPLSIINNPRKEIRPFLTKPMGTTLVGIGYHPGIRGRLSRTSEMMLEEDYAELQQFLRAKRTAIQLPGKAIIRTHIIADSPTAPIRLIPVATESLP